VAIAAVAVGALAGPAVAQASAAAPLTGVDLSRYQRIGRYDLPEPTRTAAPANSLLAQEASAVTYDWDTDTLFVAGDGGTSIVQVDKTGHLIDSMTLAPGGSPQGTTFYDTEGLTYVGNGQFVMTEERDRQLVRFSYAPNTTLTRAQTQTVKLGTTIGNIGLEGVTNDPLTGGFVVVKEKQPEGIFQTGVDWSAGTATNGSPTTDESTNLFDPALAGLLDFSDVYALSNLTTLTGPDTSHLLILSQESGKIENVDRSGVVESSLVIPDDPGNPLSVPDQTHEGITMDDDGTLYTVAEDGGGDADHPQLWVYAPSTAANQAPTAVTLTNPIASIPDTTNTSGPVKVAGVAITDDGLGTNDLTVGGPDAAAFQVDSTGLYLKAGTQLSAATKSSYSVTVSVDDPTVGATPDATSATYTLHVTAGSAGQASLIVSEVSPWSSGNSSYAADWWELTNTGASAVDLTGYKMDDDSNAFANAVSLYGVTSVAPGESVIFIEGGASTAAAFKSAWFGAGVPAGLQVGYYSGSGVGLSTDGDAVNVFDSVGNRVTGVNVPASTTGYTFDNAAGLGSTTLPLPTVSTLSAIGTHGAFKDAAGEVGSPGTIGAAPAAPKVIISEVSPASSGNSTYEADWFEATNSGSAPVSVSGWKMDDNSNAFANAVALNGVTSIAPGESVIFVEGDASTAAAFKTAWFGASVPAGLQVGYYSGSGVGLSTGGDAVNLFDGSGARVTGVAFGSASATATFDNAAGIGGTTLPLPTISTLSAVGTNGAFKDAGGEIGSPGTIANASSGGASTSAQTTISAPVPPQMSLTFGGSAAFNPFIVGTATTYTASTTVTVSSTAGDATLTVVDPDTAAPGHLVNGSYALAQPLQANAAGGAYATVSGTPATLTSFDGPQTAEAVAIGFKQPLGATDKLRSGSYSKTLTFTLSTTTP